MTEDGNLELWLKAISSVIAIIGAFIAVMKYLDERKKLNETARTESQKPFHEKQQEVYFDLVNTTAFLSNWADSDQWQANLKHFWILFWGPVPMVANQEVSKRVDDFADTLTDQPNFVDMRNASMNLARACRISLGESWNVDLQHYEVSPTKLASAAQAGGQSASPASEPVELGTDEQDQ